MYGLIEVNKNTNEKYILCDHKIKSYYSFPPFNFLYDLDNDYSVYLTNNIKDVEARKEFFEIHYESEFGSENFYFKIYTFSDQELEVLTFSKLK
jgi:hypothetical protein